MDIAWNLYSTSILFAEPLLLCNYQSDQCVFIDCSETNNINKCYDFFLKKAYSIYLLCSPFWAFWKAVTFLFPATQLFLKQFDTNNAKKRMLYL